MSGTPYWPRYDPLGWVVPSNTFILLSESAIVLKCVMYIPRQLWMSEVHMYFSSSPLASDCVNVLSLWAGCGKLGWRQRWWTYQSRKLSRVGGWWWCTLHRKLWRYSQGLVVCREKIIIQWMLRRAAAWSRLEGHFVYSRRCESLMRHYEVYFMDALNVTFNVCRGCRWLLDQTQCLGFLEC